jgi:peptidoglycan/xylan/chitin deacetylase (PgdA/CDA1 family)
MAAALNSQLLMSHFSRVRVLVCSRYWFTDCTAFKLSLEILFLEGAIMRRLSSWLIVFVTIALALFLSESHVRGQAPPPPKHAFVSFAFDDGYESAYQNAWPILQKAGIKSTWFIITHQLNHTGFITTQQLLALQSGGEEIGSHTQTHPYLSKLTPTQQQQEIVGSFDDLVALGIHPSFFAYPYGDYNSNAVTLVRSTYLGARTVTIGSVSKTDDPMLLKAVTIETLPYHVYCYDDIQKQIDQAVAGGDWLIIVFHRVDNDKGDGINAYHQTIQDVVNYLIAQNIPTGTMSQGWVWLHQ